MALSHAVNFLAKAVADLAGTTITQQMRRQIAFGAIRANFRKPGLSGGVTSLIRDVRTAGFGVRDSTFREVFRLTEVSDIKVATHQAFDPDKTLPLGEIPFGVNPLPKEYQYFFRTQYFDADSGKLITKWQSYTSDELISPNEARRRHNVNLPGSGSTVVDGILDIRFSHIIRSAKVDLPF